MNFSIIVVVMGIILSIIGNFLRMVLKSITGKILSIIGWALITSICLHQRIVKSNNFSYSVKKVLPKKEN